MDRALQEAVTQSIEGAGDRSGVKAVQRIGGGDINQAARVETADHKYFVKWHDSPPARFFECETRGLGILGLAGAMRVPTVLSYGSVDRSGTRFLILEWIETGPKSKASGARLGRDLAALHKPPQERYGLDHDNYIGSLEQPNKQNDSWVEFYRDMRLAPQRDLAAGKGRLPGQRGERLDRLMARLDKWIDDDACQPSLLHGDLWGGNWMSTPEGEPVAIDPAVYVGDREADLAMTALFGGFPPEFYSAYDEAFPRAAGHDERRPLYQLYYQLCHLNLFGEGYGAGVDRTLERYVG